MKTSGDIKKIVDKDLHIQILRDTLDDLRIENHFIRKVVLILFCMLAIAVAGIIFQNMYHQYKLFKFMSQIEYNTEIYMDNDISDNNSMNVERK